MSKYSVEEVQARFETWVSTQSWFKATLGLCRVHDAYSDPCINSRWQGWQAAYAKRIEADESEVTDEVVQKAWAALRQRDVWPEEWNTNDMRAALLAVWPSPPAQAAQVDGRLSDELRDFIEGMSVSVDVSTGEVDAGHRYFGTVTEVMDCSNDKHGVTLLVQDAEANFKPSPAVAIGFRHRTKGSGPDWSYNYHRAPDSFELRECEIETVWAANAPSAEPTAEPVAQGELVAIRGLIYAMRSAVREDANYGGHENYTKACNAEEALITAVGHLAAQPRAVPDGWRRALERALPFLDDEAIKYEDDSNNEPLDVADTIRDLLAAAPPHQRQVHLQGAGDEA